MTTRTVTYRGYEITRKITGYAYAKSGNAWNPTPRIIWISPDGVATSTLRAAKEYIDLAIDMGELTETEKGN